MSAWLRPLVAIGVAMGTCLAGTADAPAYDFEVSGQTIGQGYTLRSLRLTSPDLNLDRRRFTQSLSLDIWNIGRTRDHRPYRMERLTGPRISFTSYLRIDHDFGDWSTGALLVDNRLHDAVDLIPELESDLVNLEILYAYMAVEDLAGGLLDLYVGRQLDTSGPDWWNMDGVTAKLSPRLPVTVSVFGGLRVRDASPMGSAAYEPDGTGSGECAEYVEGAVPGSGAWRPIDRQLIVENNPFTSDYDICPQRRQAMPMAGATVETRDLGPVRARVSYRRAMSKTPGLIGAVDRFEYPDTGLYPDDAGQAPDWGVNEEVISGSVSTDLLPAGAWMLMPYAAARYSLLAGAMDEAHAGLRLSRGAHRIEPELFYSLPVFDGDSIFNVFGAEAYTDGRITYELAPRKSRLGGFARGWVRRFAGSDGAALAGGIQAGARYEVPRRARARLDVFHDGGRGSTRTGGYATGRWQATDKTGLSARLSVVQFADEARAGEARRGTSVGVQAGASYELNQGILLHVLAEETMNDFTGSRLRLMSVIDLAFFPET